MARKEAEKAIEVEAKKKGFYGGELYHQGDKFNLNKVFDEDGKLDQKATDAQFSKQWMVKV